MFGRLKDLGTSIRDRSRRLRRSTGAAIARAWTAASGEIGRDELHFYGALMLIAIGCWGSWRPGSYLIPAGVLIWVSMPMRSGFIDRQKPSETKKG